MTGSGAVKGATPVVDDAAAPPPRNRWIIAVTDRVPSKWLGGIATGAVLAATAAFGGLASVPVPPIPELTGGEAFAGAGLELTAQRVILLDRSRASGVIASEGERLLILFIEATNIDNVPRQAMAEGSVSEVRVDGVDDAPMIARVDDATISPWLQPGVPAEIMLTWAVPASLFTDGDDARIDLHTATKQAGKFVIAGEFWDDVTLAAHLTLAVDDGGVGDAE